MKILQEAMVPGPGELYIFYRLASKDKNMDDKDEEISYSNTNTTAGKVGWPPFMQSFLLDLF